MNCPECGQFMRRYISFELGIGSPEDAGHAYWWWCNNEWGHTYIVDPVAAPEYDWLWFAEGIPAEALLQWDGLRAEYDEMWSRLPYSLKCQYRHVLEPTP